MDDAGADFSAVGRGAVVGGDVEGAGDEGGERDEVVVEGLLRGDEEVPF